MPAKKKTLSERLKSIAELITAGGVIAAAVMAVGTWAISNINADTNKKLDDISDKIDSIELNSTRNQLLTLMSNYPDNESEIMKVAEYYFRDLGGDWYMTELFSQWSSSHGVDASQIITMKGK